jgi:hypothetical protein
MPAQANSSQDSISKKNLHKNRASEVAQCRLWVQAPVLQKKKKRHSIQTCFWSLFSSFNSSLEGAAYWVVLDVNQWNLTGEPPQRKPSWKVHLNSTATMTITMAFTHSLHARYQSPNLSSRQCYHHFKHEETEIQTAQETCPKSHQQQFAWHQLDQNEVMFPEPPFFPWSWGRVDQKKLNMNLEGGGSSSLIYANFSSQLTPPYWGSFSPRKEATVLPNNSWWNTPLPEAGQQPLHTCGPFLPGLDFWALSVPVLQECWLTTFL